MWIIQFAVFGLVAGAIARLLHPGRDPMNWIWTMLLGIGGALIGGWIGGQLGFNTSTGVASWMAAVFGSILLLVVHHFATTQTPGPDGTTSTGDYKKAVFDDLARGPNP